METHVSSTTADVPETQEVIGLHGNVEIVIAVEKLVEDIQQKADSNSQDNAQPVMEGSTTTKTDGFHKSPSKEDLLQQPTGKEMNLNKSAQPSIKTVHRNIQTMINVNKTDNLIPPNKVPAKPIGVVIQKASAKKPSTPVAVDSTSLKDTPMEETLDEVDNKNDITLNITAEREPSNESQSEMICDASEKEYNKSISRELKSLINSAKESKIISECTKLTSKTRKSRVALDTSNSNLNSTPEADSMQGNRRSSSNSSEKSESVGKRSMRSQNPEFVHKVRKFLNSVTGKFQKGGDSDVSSASDEEMVTIKNKQNTTAIASPSTANNRNSNIDQAQTKPGEKSNKLRSDPYCWRCHWSIDMNDGEKTPQPPLKCTVCPRAFHFRCLTSTERTKISSEKNWVCPECMTVLHAESSETRSSAMKKTSLGMLCELLKYALQRMTEINGGEPFLQPVDRAVFPDYDKYVVHPMDLSLMKEHISEGLYGSTEAFLGDAHWILHNSIIFNTLQSKLTTAARALVRSCRAEMGEIEACPECYAAAHARRPTWFTDVCSTPHLLLWAKLKGFPYWPAKAMSVSQAGLVDVRFFGAHDRAWVPARDCYLYCERDPNNFRTKRHDIIDSMQEAVQHIRNISRKYGKFVYAPYRTTFDASKLEEALKTMIPSFDGPVKSPIRDRRPKTPALGKKSRSNSKGSKGDSNAGDVMSDSEPMEVETSKTEEAQTNEAGRKTPNMSTRKRRRSELKESWGTVPDSGPKDKRGRVENDANEAPKKTDSPLVSSTKEVVQKHPERGDGASEEPIEVNSTPSKPDPVRPSANKSNNPAKSNKPNPKTNNIAPSNKTSPKTDNSKNNEKERNTQEEKTPQNQRLSRSKVEEVNVNTSSPNKIPVLPSNNKAKTCTSKDSPKESLSINKTNETEKVPESAVLIKIDEKGKDSSVSVKVNAKDKVTEIATVTKMSDIVKNTENKGKVKEEEAVSTTPNKDSRKQKVIIATPVKNVEKVTNTPPVTSSNKYLGSEKTTDGATVTNNTTPGHDKPKNMTNEASTTSGTAEKEKATESSSVDKTPRAEKPADASTDNKKDNVDKEKSTPGKNTSTPKPGTSKVIKATRDRIQFDDDTSLAVIARKVPKTSGNSDATATASASGARSATAGPSGDAPPAFSAPPTPPTPPTPPATRSSNAANTKTTQITVEVKPDSSIFTPTHRTENVRNMKEAVNKLQKLRSGLEAPTNPQVGKVGVRAFARMTSLPEKQEKSDDVLVEIKSEPMDYKDSDAQLESSTVLESLRPRPVAPVVSGTNLREVRISKVMPAPVLTKKSVKPADVGPRAKKTFPQPKKPEDGRLELTNKNSMVYIPIQPPISQAPVRAALKATVHNIGPATSTTTRPPALSSTTNAVKGVTCMAPPLLPMAPPPPPPPPPPSTTAAATSAALAGAILSPGFPSVPTTVHTVPLITSVNGQWTFSLQPVMSVGGGDQQHQHSITTATVNGVSERSPGGVAVSPAAPPAPPAAPPAPPAAPPAPPAASPAASAAPPPAPSQPPALVPTGCAAPSNPCAVTTTITRTPDGPKGEPPRLQQRPVLQSPLAASTEIGELTAPSAAGPLTAKLNHNSIKLAEFFRNLLEDSLVQVEEPAADAAALRLQIEQERWRHQHELTELRHSHELLLVELRAAMAKEKARAVAEARRLAHQELEAAVKSAKSKQWCANCSQEAQFYCCWNTSYCDYPCQRAHWAQHYASCTQQRTPGISAESRAAAEPAPPPADAPKTKSAPSLTVASKMTSATSRIVNSEHPQNKSTFVVTAPEDGGPGASRGAGASPQAAGPTPLHAAPLLANKQLISNEESGTKRVLTSGGYLIVGAGAGAGAGAAVMAAPAPRRAPRRD